MLEPFEPGSNFQLYHRKRLYLLDWKEFTVGPPRELSCYKFHLSPESLILETWFPCIISFETAKIWGELESFLLKRWSFLAFHKFHRKGYKLVILISWWREDNKVCIMSGILRCEAARISVTMYQGWQYQAALEKDHKKECAFDHLHNHI
jgi:hypothetical protein